jgi:hypothetical protein
MKLTFEEARWTLDEKGFWLCLQVKETAQARQFVSEKKDKTYTADVREYRKSRSLNANSYMWVLCESLSEKLGIDKEDIYRRAVKESGLSRDLELPNDAIPTMQRAWERQGIAWFSEKVDGVTENKSLVRFYYGSSCYNSKQMARLLDNIVQECHAQEIDTLTPSERALLCDKWEAQT